MPLIPISNMPLTGRSTHTPHSIQAHVFTQMSAANFVGSRFEKFVRDATKLVAPHQKELKKQLGRTWDDNRPLMLKMWEEHLLSECFVGYNYPEPLPLLDMLRARATLPPARAHPGCVI